MMSALFFVLKIVGWILLVIVAVILLLLLVFCFAPVRYTGKMQCLSSKERLRIKFCATWLLDLIRLDIVYNKDTLKWRLRIAWKKIMGKRGEDDDKNQKSDHQDHIKAHASTTSDIPLAKQKDEKKRSQSLEKSTQEVQKEKENYSKQNQETLHKTKNRKKSLWKKTGRKIEKIKCTFQGLCDKIDEIKDFLDDDVHREAFSAIIRHMKPLLSSVFSGKLSGHILFGFEDPSHTGLCLAACGVIYPFFGGEVEIAPDFQNKIFSGCLKIDGKWRVFHVLAFAVKILLSGKIRRTYKDFKIIQEGIGG